VEVKISLTSLDDRERVVIPKELREKLGLSLINASWLKLEEKK